MHSRGSRVARGGIAGVFATAVAAAGHGLADGMPPSTLALVLGAVFATVLGTVAIGRRPSLPRLAVVVAGSQVAFHLVFSWLTPGTATVGHHGSAMLVTAETAHHGPNPWMWIAHALALVATVAFLRRAELALWNLLRAAVAALTPGRRLPAIAARPPAPRVSSAAAPRHPLVVALSSVLTRRGPPLLVAA